VIKATAARDGSCDISDIADLGTLAAAARQKGSARNMEAQYDDVHHLHRRRLPFTRGVFPEPRFKLEALRFRALNETGIDRFGSDEVYPSTSPRVRSQPSPKYSAMLARAKQGAFRSIKAASFQSLA
jgi:hypothetical protein